jgi:hypothetical protein
MNAFLQFFILSFQLFIHYLFLGDGSLLSLADDAVDFTFGFVPGLNDIFLCVLLLGH